MDPPNPWMQRKASKNAKFGDSTHKNDPNEKTPTPDKKIFFSLNRSESFPNKINAETWARMYDNATHDA